MKRIRPLVLPLVLIGEQNLAALGSPRLRPDPWPGLLAPALNGLGALFDGPLVRVLESSSVDVLGVGADRTACVESYG